MVRATGASAREHYHRFHLPGTHLPHGLVTFPRRPLAWIEPWFLAYACLGVVQGGMLPMLLPLSASGSTHAGTIVGVMNLAGLTSLIWGHVADRRRIHRRVLLLGMVAVLVALLLMPAQLGLPLKAALAAILGVGFAAANTVANMFIVEVWPQEEWDARIGSLQAVSGIGQVVGLLLAGFIGGRYALAFGVAAALVAAALPIAWLTLRGVHVSIARNAAVAHPPLGGEGWVGAPQRHFHLPTWPGFAKLLRELEMPLVRLQIVWFAAFVAIGAVLTMFPLALVRTFGVSHAVPATAYAFAAAGSLPIYPLAASIAQRRGARFVLRGGFGVRTVAIAILTGAFLSPNYDVTLALAGFVILVLAWPLLGVSGTALVAELARGEKGEALGLFNAFSSLAGAVGAFLGGSAMDKVGYGAVCMAAALLMGLVTLLSGAMGARPDRPATPGITSERPP
ncbi:MAG TPA: MFS transporter [Candidatus Margulisiibacteriota bacterium]|nr:MFS transporter [Candidatus Margulisiibacteriota bacterium]